MQAEQHIMKLKWSVSPAPTGRYRSFQQRAWPQASIAGTDTPMAYIVCEDQYTAEAARTGSHKPLTVRVADHTPRGPGSAAWVWRKLKGEYLTLQEAKTAAQKVLNHHPEMWPKDVK